MFVPFLGSALRYLTTTCCVVIDLPWAWNWDSEVLKNVKFIPHALLDYVQLGKAVWSYVRQYRVGWVVAVKQNTAM